MVACTLTSLPGEGIVPAVVPPYRKLCADWRSISDAYEKVSSPAEALAVTASIERDEQYSWRFSFDCSVEIGVTGGVVGGAASPVVDTILDSVVANPDDQPADCRPPRETS
jgi:hypothetical protein